MLALESADSIRFLYRHFLSKITEKSLNAFYYACSYAKADYSGFMNTTVSLAMRLVPELLCSQPVFLCIDDTLVPKSGRKFKDVSSLFDHAAHGGSSYLNGHCFVSLMLRVPVWRNHRVSYLEIPLGYRMWKKDCSKLALAAGMVRQVMPALSAAEKVIILCDSWYAKKDIASLADEFRNLDIICNVRIDSVVHDLPPERTGGKGRPAKHGRKLSVQDDFILSGEKIGDYYIAARKVLTNLFGRREVLAYVTAADKGSGSRRLFFSTVSPSQLQIFCAWQEDEMLHNTGSSWMQYIPLFFYRFRWPIETGYYEQKTFWSLCSYMVRSSRGIEMLVNLINIAYCGMKLLPYADNAFAQYQNCSTQDFRFELSERIREQVFFASFVSTLENGVKSNAVISSLERWVFRQERSTQSL